MSTPGPLDGINSAKMVQAPQTPPEQTASWHDFEVRSIEVEEKIPRQPKWLTSHKKTLSDRLITYQGPLKKLLTPLSQIARQYQLSRVKSLVAELKSANSGETLRKCFSELDHELIILKNLRLDTDSYGQNDLKWLRDEALQRYAEYTLDQTAPNFETMVQVKNLLETTNGHQQNALDSSFEVLKGRVHTRIAQLSDNPVIQQKHLEKALVLFQNTWEEPPPDSIWIDVEDDLDEEFLPEEESPQAVTENFKNELNDACEQLLQSSLPSHDLGLLVSTQRLATDIFTETGQDTSEHFPGFLQKLAKEFYEAPASQEEKLIALDNIRNFLFVNRAHVLKSKALQQTYADYNFIEGKLLSDSHHMNLAVNRFRTSATYNRTNPSCYEYARASIAAFNRPTMKDLDREIELWKTALSYDKLSSSEATFFKDHYQKLLSLRSSR